MRSGHTTDTTPSTAGSASSVNSGACHLDPTYRFTSDGRQVHHNASKLLSGIRKLEKNPAVLGQAVMWGSLLKDPGDAGHVCADAPYSHLGFGDFLAFESPVGISDDEWLS